MDMTFGSGEWHCTTIAVGLTREHVAFYTPNNGEYWTARARDWRGKALLVNRMILL